MCNLAGYAGSRRAAPILLEMLRAQQAYNGGKSTGIATIHEGKIHMRKIVGNVDDLIREIPVWELTCRPDEDAARLSYETMCCGTEGVI